MSGNGTEWPADAVQRVPIKTLVPYPSNARTHSAGQIDQLAASIREWGFAMPLLVDVSNTVIAGHGRLEAAKLLGLEEVPVMVAKGWSAKQIKAYRIADNQLALNAAWDVKLLAAELGELTDMQDLIGFSDDDLHAILNGRQGLTDPDEAPPLPAEPVTRRGDLWVCGRHRIMCGDCRDPGDMATLVDGRSINVAFTSPPYAEQRDYDETSGFKPIQPEQYVAWFEPVARNVAEHLAPDGSWFVNIKPSAAGTDTELYVFDLVLAHVRQWGWHFATEFCWERVGVPKAVTQRFKNQFEPIYQFARNRWKMCPDAVRHESDNVPRAGGPGSGQTTWNNGQGQVNGIKNSFGAAKKRRHGTVALMSSMQGVNAAPGEYIGSGLAYPGNRLPTFTGSHTATGHAAAFPVGLPEFFFRAYSDDGDVIFDPFLGSGSSIIAAEQTERCGLGMEISPAYCDIAVQRWEAFTGETAERHARPTDPT